ncbi:MAG: type III glutamate--ammonia ligase, partial [Proteobacteria bacterium]|nr:type III glutamate--ammonia ligase [Pseudomonadota bacterium]
KPFPHLTGNGCHTHVSLWNNAGLKNLFFDKQDEMGVSELGYHFLGGILHSASALTAFFNPTVNSYKRLMATTTASGATWSPNAISYGGNNRTHLVRIPDTGRFELRLMDGSANPYLSQAAILAAGLDGIDNNRDPGKRLDINMYDAGSIPRGVKRLPLSLFEALEALSKSKILEKRIGAVPISSYLKLKTAEWRDYLGHHSRWETDHTLDC